MTNKKSRKRYTTEFKAEALKLAERVGVKEAANQLGVYESQIYNWRLKAQKRSTVSQRESDLAAEVAKLKRQLAEQDEELSNLKKGGYLLREEPKISRFEFMLEHQHRFKMKTMVSVLDVSRSGYYAWRKQDGNPSPRQQKRQERDEKVKAAFDASKGRDGARRIQVELEENGTQADVKTINDSMKRQGLEAKATRKFKVTTDSNHKLPVAPNLLNQEFSAKAPNEKWVSDITYLATSEGWLYLAVFIDLYSRAVVGWSMAPRMTSDLVCDALTMAQFKRDMPKGVLIHSDQGSQYCSHAFRDIINTHEHKQSMSRKGNCWDNAVAESFFHSMKVEAIDNELMKTREEMRQTVFEYIEVDYNRTRRHSALGYLSPENYELKKIA
ncbi:IS3 family transposase [Saccharobesus litoralis]|uniref:IS3 family transposase n=1 Tax=Saccharobesus litoralis TaxID=2172099 RepID=A0A2S0VPA2_9ALTE|nr:IS3 family transposase [Saccharobesus litoralis]AWB66029.1 IS3 family transposase [Saccharobesus litoralis]